MQPALRFNNPRLERLAFSRQPGVRNVIVHPYAQSYIAETDLPLPIDEVWTVDALVALRE